MSAPGAFCRCSLKQGDQPVPFPGAEGFLGTPDFQWQNQECPEQTGTVGHPRSCAEQASKGLGCMWL